MEFKSSDGRPVTVRSNPIGTSEKGRYDYTEHRGKLYVLSPGASMTLNSNTQEVIETDECRRVSKSEARRFLRALSQLQD